MTMRLTLFALIAAALAAAPASAAGPIPLLASSSSTPPAIAVAGPDVIVLRSAPLGTVRVDALPTDGGAARSLLRTAPRGEDWDAYSAVNASSQRVAVVAFFISPKAEFFSALYSGPRTGPLTLVEQVREGTGWEPDDVIVDGDRMLVREENGDANRLRLFVPGAAPRVVPLSSPLTGNFAFAGDRLAYQSHDRMILADLATGSRLLSARGEDFASLDVAADGTMLADGDDIGVFTVKPFGLRQGVPDGEFLSSPRYAGSAIAAMEETPSQNRRPVVLDADAIHTRPIGLPSSTIDEFDADARGVAWIANNCVLYATLDAMAPAEPPPGPCARAEVEVDNASYTVRGRTLRLEAECIAATATGCDGTVTIRDVGVRGHGAFHLDAGQDRKFSVRFTRRSVRHIRRDLRKHDDVTLGMITRLTDGGPPDRDDDVVVFNVR
ncbi:MAG TPA: hypothetical protein VFX51_25545 [Solirubrobacteraceae bacterium]|nr:hypothetical protein [Solirubrobacteraceae bacterium]